MGICESTSKENYSPKILQQNEETKKDQKIQSLEEENSNNKETHPSTCNQQDNKSSKSDITQRAKKGNCPELIKYERSGLYSGLKSENSMHNNKSIISSCINEEEVIIRGEINKNCKNKEEDFDNNSFKKLVKNNGGIILKNGEQLSNICSVKDNIPIFDLGKEAFSEINSKISYPQYNRSLFNVDLSNSGTFTGFYNHSCCEKNRNFLHKNSQDINLMAYNLRNSTKSNFLSNENNFNLIIPRTDEPLPDIDELSTASPLIINPNPLISE